MGKMLCGERISIGIGQACPCQTITTNKTTLSNQSHRTLSLKTLIFFTLFKFWLKKASLQPPGLYLKVKQLCIIGRRKKLSCFGLACEDNPSPSVVVDDVFFLQSQLGRSHIIPERRFDFCSFEGQQSFLILWRSPG